MRSAWVDQASGGSAGLGAGWARERARLCAATMSREKSFASGRAARGSFGFADAAGCLVATACREVAFCRRPCWVPPLPQPSSGGSRSKADQRETREKEGMRGMMRQDARSCM
ncbi:hypothetical protein MVI01_21930 [Myxococcus virescens]|uniref:Uncharacterized protein n=1 Tax=Myxococcus virescens TaxID=83456 RepID=A0A511HCL7_9BACT|nr:hypothetical protein MVI01_21930 [Myxococcus virescens]